MILQTERRIFGLVDNNSEMTAIPGPWDQANADMLRLEEATLRRAVARGDEQAWRTLYDATFAKLFAYARWRCGGRIDRAEELVQETWLVAVRRIRSFDPDQGSFLNWVRGICANLLRNELRRRRLPQSLEGVDPPAPNPVNSEGHDQGLRIAQALDELSARHEAVLRAKYVDQRRVADIAREWGESIKAVESLLTRARAAFRLAYGQLQGNEGIKQPD